MKNKLSHSALNKYLTCGRLYENHYLKRLRGKTTSGALLVGSAMDKALNKMLEDKVYYYENLDEVLEVFDKEFNFGYINGKYTALSKSENIVYAKRDFDIDLLNDQDLKNYNQLRIDISLGTGDDICENVGEIKEDIDWILDQKEEKGWENLSNNNKQLYNYANWLSMRRKSHLMLKAYQKQVLPKIKQVLAVQKHMLLTGKTGDDIECYIDLIVEWEDGKRYVIDNKTSYMQYEQDSPSKSPQLILYNYAANKEGFKLDGAGFIVMYKMIDKNKIKTCEVCKYDGTGERHKTCPSEVFKDEKTSEMFRCNGKWIETINPECRVEVILNPISLEAQNLIIQTFQAANEGIKAKHFGPNPNACMQYGSPCVYAKLCWGNSMEGLIEMDKKND